MCKHTHTHSHARSHNHTHLGEDVDLGDAGVDAVGHWNVDQAVRATDGHCKRRRTSPMWRVNLMWLHVQTAGKGARREALMLIMNVNDGEQMGTVRAEETSLVWLHVQT